MKKLYILLLIAVFPGYISAAKYTNKTSGILTISKTNPCDGNNMMLDTSLDSDVMDIASYEYAVSESHATSMHEVCQDGQCVESMDVDDEPCTKIESIELLPGQSVDFENDQGQLVTIMSVSLNEKYEFAPTNDSFNYEISESHFGPKFSRLNIHHA